MAEIRNPFKAYQDAQQESRRQLITEELIKLQLDKMTFPTLTHLARRLADMINQRMLISYHNGKLTKMPAKIFPSTFLKNDMYRALLVSFISGNFVAKGSPRIKKAEVESLRKMYPGIDAYICSIELRITGLETQLERAQHFYPDGVNKRLFPPVMENAEAVDAKEHQRVKDDLDKTVTALSRIVGRVEYFEIDKHQKIIVDKSRFDAEVVDKRLLEPFFAHLTCVPILTHESEP